MFLWLSSMVGRVWQWQRLARVQQDPLRTGPAVVEDDYWRMKPEAAGRW